MKEEFIKFLKSRRLWSKFQREFENGNMYNKGESNDSYYSSIEEYIEDKINSNGIADLVGCAFIWDDDIWIDIHDQWQQHLTKLK